MKHLTKKRSWECMLYSFAMALEVSPDEIVSYLGHDGSYIVVNKGNQADPYCRAGFHPQEFIDFAYAMQRSKFVAPYEIVPVSLVNGEQHAIINPQRMETFEELVKNQQGVITGCCISNRSKHHAVAFSQGEIHDPDLPHTYAFKDVSSFTPHNFQPLCVWVVI